MKIDALVLDLSSQKSVRRAASEFNSTAAKLDILINNAGIMAVPGRTLSEEGIELQFATNHVGHFLFTNLVLEKLRVAANQATVLGATRIINVSSNGHRFSPIRFDDWNFEGKVVSNDQLPDVSRIMERIGSMNWTNGYEKFVAYGQSKTANVLFALHLREKLAEDGILSFSVHPGSKYKHSLACRQVMANTIAAIGTNLIRNMFTSTAIQTATKLSMREGILTGSYKSIDGGAATTIFAAFDPSIDGELSFPYY